MDAVTVVSTEWEGERITLSGLDEEAERLISDSSWMITFTRDKAKEAVMKLLEALFDEEES